MAWQRLGAVTVDASKITHITYDQTSQRITVWVVGGVAAATLGPYGASHAAVIDRIVKGESPISEVTP